MYVWYDLGTSFYVSYSMFTTFSHFPNTYNTFLLSKRNCMECQMYQFHRYIIKTKIFYFFSRFYHARKVGASSVSFLTSQLRKVQKMLKKFKKPSLHRLDYLLPLKTNFLQRSSCILEEENSFVFWAQQETC